MIELRPVRTAEDRELYVAVRNAMHPDTPLSVEAHFSSSRQDDRADLLAYLDGQPVGTATGRRHFEDRDSRFATVSVRVRREARRRGVGTALFAAISEHARSIGRTGLYTIVRLDDADSRDYLGRRGFEEVFRVEEVALSLDGAEADATPPDGVTLVPFDPELDERVHPVALEVDRDRPAYVPIAPLAFDAWRDRVLGPGVLRDLSVVALAGDEVVGYAVLGEDAPGTAEDWFTGVRRDWRGRGLGRALKAAQVDAAQRAGLRELRASIEAVNIPLRRICERLGYRPRLTWLDLAGPLLLAGSSVGQQRHR